MLENWVTMEMIGQFAMALVIVRYVVEYTKSGLDVVVAWLGSLFHREWRLPTSLFAYAVSFALIYTHRRLTGEVTSATLFLGVINAFVVSIAAGFMRKPEKETATGVPHS